MQIAVQLNNRPTVTSATMGRKKQQPVQEEATTTVRTWRPRARHATLDTVAPPRARPASVALEATAAASDQATTELRALDTALPRDRPASVAVEPEATMAAAPVQATTELRAAPEGATAAPDATTAELMAAAEVEPAAEAMI